MNILINAIESIHTLFWLNPWAQSVGLIALIVGSSAFLQKEDHKLKLILTFFTVLMTIQFLMLDLYTAALAAGLGSLRNYISFHTRNLWVMIIFLVIMLGLSLPNVKEWFHLLPIFASVLGTWGMFREKGIQMRMYMSIGSICWLTHNLIVGTIGGTIIESVFLMINSRTMIKLLIEQRQVAH